MMREHMGIIKDLKEQLATIELCLEKSRGILEKIACLGNGNSHGNSIGNCIAIEALQLQPDLSALNEERAKVLKSVTEDLINEFCAYKNHTSDELFVDTAIELIKDFESGMTCKDEGCPHYGTPHSHSRMASNLRRETT
jgi:hypothetical protein